MNLTVINAKWCLITTIIFILDKNKDPLSHHELVDFKVRIRAKDLSLQLKRLMLQDAKALTRIRKCGALNIR